MSTTTAPPSIPTPEKYIHDVAVAPGELEKMAESFADPTQHQIQEGGGGGKAYSAQQPLLQDLSHKQKVLMDIKRKEAIVRRVRPLN